MSRLLIHAYSPMNEGHFTKKVGCNSLWVFDIFKITHGSGNKTQVTCKHSVLYNFNELDKYIFIITLIIYITILKIILAFLYIYQLSLYAISTHSQVHNYFVRLWKDQKI
jgi:hypothetical protein